MDTIRQKIKLANALLSEKSPRKYGAVFAIIVALMLICEFLVFNFKWIHSAFDKEFTTTTEDISSGLTQINADSFQINSDSAVIEIDNINQKLKYLRFTPGEDKGIKADITVAAVDEANANYLSAPSRTVLSDVKMSQYIRLHFSGNVEKLKITINGMNGRTVDAAFIGLNARVPLMFSWLRFIFMTLTVMALFILRPKSSIYKYKTDLTKSWQKNVAVALVVIQSLAFLVMINWNTNAVNWYKSFPHHQQYYSLVEAFKNGHFYISDEVSDELINMDNPYDPSARGAKGIQFKWDTAYYNGKYYCYFGVVPALILYLPYNVMTGQDMPNHIALYIFGVMTMIGILLLLWEIIKKWYRNTPFVIYLLLSVVFSAVAGIAYTIFKPDFYMVPSLSALMFAVWGLALWMSAEKPNKKGKIVLSSKRLAFGSVFIALTAGCRPQFLLTAILGVMFFWDYTFKTRTLFSRNSIKHTMAVCLPFIVVGLLLMWYNFARFDSPFDFGANYNLTTNDMTHRGFVFGRTGLGIFTYFLQPIRMNSIFPFIHDFGSETIYQGLTLTEKLMGGVLTLYPILIIGVFGITQKKLFNDRRAYIMVCLSVIMAIVIAVMDTQMAGLLTRYFTDFVWLVMLASVITIFALYDEYIDSINTEKNVINITIVLSTVTLVFAFLSIFAHTENPVQISNPKLYYTMQHLIAFWM